MNTKLHFEQYNFCIKNSHMTHVWIGLGLAVLVITKIFWEK